MKTDTVFKKAFNRTLELMVQGDIEDPLPSENELRRRLGVSRTTIRKVLAELVHRCVISTDSISLLWPSAAPCSGASG